MKALCWHGEEDVRVDEVPDPEIVNPHDANVLLAVPREGSHPRPPWRSRFTAPVFSAPPSDRRGGLAAGER